MYDRGVSENRWGFVGLRGVTVRRIRRLNGSTVKFTRFQPFRYPHKVGALTAEQLIDQI